jgi:hypothetical protein
MMMAEVKEKRAIPVLGLCSVEDRAREAWSEKAEDFGLKFKACYDYAVCMHYE